MSARASSTRRAGVLCFHLHRCGDRFWFTHGRTAAPRDYVVAGSGEWPEGQPFPEAIVARGDLSSAGLAAKVKFVVDTMKARCAGLGADWSDLRQRRSTPPRISTDLLEKPFRACRSDRTRAWAGASASRPSSNWNSKWMYVRYVANWCCSLNTIQTKKVRSVRPGHPERYLNAWALRYLTVEVILRRRLAVWAA